VAAALELLLNLMAGNTELPTLIAEATWNSGTIDKFNETFFSGYRFQYKTHYKFQRPY
jgi:hypothetical protein